MQVDTLYGVPALLLSRQATQRTRKTSDKHASMAPSINITMKGIFIFNLLPTRNPVAWFDEFISSH